MNYDTAEYRATAGAVSANALTAYSHGGTGAGIAVGVIDSGIDLQSAEFGSRISSASANVAGGTTVDDEGGHGTAVAFTIAGRRNDAGTHGIAFDATLIVARADTPGTCATMDAKGNPDCKFNDSSIARGVDLAVANGARVINMSLGGSAPNATLTNAIDRATAAGVIIVIAAGNDGTVNPDPFAEIANRPQARGLVIIAGSVGANDSRTPGADVISTFSDRAGDGAAHFLTAVGESVRAPDQNNVAYLWSGTSFSAPQIAGAAALLAQAFPTLTSAQIVNLLFTSARDAGAAGVDPIYGQGVLDLTRAFSPIGTTMIAGVPAPVSLGSNAMLSAPMGDAHQGPLGAVILDGFGRAFSVDLAGTINRSGPERTLAASLSSRTRNLSIASGNMTMALTVQPTAGGGVSVGRLQLSDGQARTARAVAGIITNRLTRTSSIAFGFSESGAALSQTLGGISAPGFLVAQDPVRGAGFDSAVKASTAYRQQLGRYGLTATAESGDVLSRDGDALPAARGNYRRFGYDRTALTLDRRFGGLALAVTGSNLNEQGSMLGAHFGSGLGGARASSWFLDAAARLELDGGWSLSGSLRQGWTFASVGGGLRGGGVLRTNAFAADIGKNGIFGHDSFGLRIAQPLRVASGGLDLVLPTDYDYDTGAVSAWATQRINLAPTGREIDMEARYSRPVWIGNLQTNLFVRRQPGNFALLPTDVGGAFRWSAGF
ncbi:S8 family peptidase [Sphingomonas immobilis]|uniref:S8 family peptidase n=1 Tax=Sphingomonas immobilis TaxID=3063997 RepID=A0ABT9A3Z9_9SPHN|nr:S8 family peptidase [Sphingomonas sp. CA1-15]MDO7844540.1 S8 family peptidase [Sphingomonas sp. CA1-15]